MRYLLNLSYMSLYSVQHQDNVFPPALALALATLMVLLNSIHTLFCRPEYYIQQMNYCVNDIFAEFIVHITVQCLESGRFVPRHWHWHWPHLWCCQMVCQPHFLSLNTTTNESFCKWHICWIYCTYHCTAFSIRKIGFSALALALATPIAKWYADHIF